MIPADVAQRHSPRRGSSSRPATGSATAPTPTARSACRGRRRPLARRPDAVVPRTQRDPTRHRGHGRATFVNTESPLVGRLPDLRLDQGVPQARAATRRSVRASSRSAPTASSTSTPRCWAAPAGVDGWWVGLELLHTLFMREHNAVCDTLHAAYPSWSDDQLFDERTAGHRRAHREDPHRGVDDGDPRATPRCASACAPTGSASPGSACATWSGGSVGSEVISGIPGSATDHHGAPYSITEEFVAVYRMHPLIPDDSSVRVRRPTPRAREHVPFLDLRGLRRPASVLGTHGVRRPALLASAPSHPGAVTLHNHPRFLQQFRRGRRPAHRPRRHRHPALPGARRAPLQRVPAAAAPAAGRATFEELTRRPGDGRASCAAVYDGDIEHVDLTVGHVRRAAARRASASATPPSASSS